MNITKLSELPTELIETEYAWACESIAKNFQGFERGQQIAREMAHMVFELDWRASQEASPSISA